MARVTATPIIARDLQPGDLFSTVGNDYWATALDAGGIGERVYIRTNGDADIASDGDSKVYKIEVVK